ncbi:TPA: hypothetical protein ACN2LR_002721, partial [Staphylococcus aureus]
MQENEKILQKVLDAGQVGKRRKNGKYRKSQKRNFPELHFRLCNTCHNVENIFLEGSIPFLVLYYEVMKMTNLTKTRIKIYIN